MAVPEDDVALCFTDIRFQFDLHIDLGEIGIRKYFQFFVGREAVADEDVLAQIDRIQMTELQIDRKIAVHFQCRQSVIYRPRTECVVFLGSDKAGDPHAGLLIPGCQFHISVESHAGEALREEVGAEAHIFFVCAAFDQVFNADRSGCVVFDFDALRIMGDGNVLDFAEMTVEADDIQSDLMEYGKIIRRRAEFREDFRIGICAYSQSRLMGNRAELLEVCDDLFLCFRYRQETCKYTLIADASCFPHIGICLFFCRMFGKYRYSKLFHIFTPFSAGSHRWTQ